MLVTLFFSWYPRMPGLVSVYVVGTVDTNHSITKGQVCTMIICRQVADIAWYPLYSFGYEYHFYYFVSKWLLCELGLSIAGIGHKHYRAAIVLFFNLLIY